MSVESRYKPVSYTGTGGTSVFPFGWVCYEKSWIHVAADGLELTQGTDYTVALESTSGGSVTLSAPLAAGKILIIWMDVPITQENRYPNTGQLNTVTIEKALDKQTLIAQQQQDAIERSVKLPVGSQEKPEDVVQNIYNARDAAAASASAASAQATAAQASATAAANSADTAEQTVQAAAAGAVADATAQAEAAAVSALAAAASAAAAEAASGGLAGRMDAVEDKNTQQDNRLNSIEQSVTATPGASKVPESQSTGKLAVGWIPGVFVGDIRLVPFRAADLAANCPGWVYCNGDQYLLASAVGIALNALPANFKADWGIVVASGYISIPKLFHTDGRGFYVRAVNGTARQVGSVATDKFQGHAHGAYGGNNDSFPGPPYWKLGNSLNGGGPSYTTIYGTDGSNGSPRTGTETSVLDVGMTPAIFLNV